MAGLLDSTKIDKLFKSLFNKARTSSNKQYYEETIPNAFDVHADEIYLNPIPSIPPTSDTGVVKLLTSDLALVLTQDKSVAGNKAWVALNAWNASWSSGSGDVTQIMQNFISPKYGSGYTVKVYKGDGTRISELDNVNWMFDYKAGVLTFENDPGMNGSNIANSIKIEVYQYIGQTVAAATTSSSLSQLTDVDFTTPAVNGNFLIYDENEQKWRPWTMSSIPALFEIVDITVAGDIEAKTTKPYKLDTDALMVFLNGVLMRRGSQYDYTEVDPYTINFNYGLEVGDSVTFRVEMTDYDNFNVTPPPTPPNNGGGSTVPVGQEIWSLDFMLDTNQNIMDFASIPGYDSTTNAMTLEDFYGANLDGNNRAITVEYYYTSSNANATWADVPADAVGQPVPLNGFDTFTAPSSNGYFDPDVDAGNLTFETWAITKNFYKIVKRGV